MNRPTPAAVALETSRRVARFIEGRPDGLTQGPAAELAGIRDTLDELARRIERDRDSGPPAPLERAGDLVDAARAMLDYEEGAESQYRTRAILAALADLLDVDRLAEARRGPR